MNPMYDLRNFAVENQFRLIIELELGIEKEWKGTPHDIHVIFTLICFFD